MSEQSVVGLLELETCITLIDQQWELSGGSSGSISMDKNCEDINVGDEPPHEVFRSMS